MPHMRLTTTSCTLALALFLAGCGAERGRPTASPLARSALDACADLGGTQKQDCYEERLLAELHASGVRPALDMLEAIADEDSDVERDAHVYTHAIGIESYDPDRPVTEVFAECTELFQSGCYHGVIQAHFIARGTVDSAGVSELCEGFKGADGSQFLLFQCLHGLGHGLTMIYAHDLPRALGACDYLGDSWDRESCYGGAFMENIVAATNPHHAATRLAAEAEAGPAGEHEHEIAGAMDMDAEPFVPLRADDPHYPCSILADRYLTACYMMQTSAMLQQNGTDVGAAAANCSDAPERWRRTCFQSLGRDISSITLQDFDDSLHECRKVPDEFREWCYVGLVKNFVDLTATTDRGFAFCRLVEDTAKPRCYEALGEEIHVLFATAAERRTACEAAEDDTSEQSCLRGARVPTG